MPDDVTTFTSKSAETISYQPGDVVGGAYVLLTFLARGGMGVVYRAWHEQLDREFALKLLAPMAMTDVNWKRFELEARTLAKLQHPNVVQIFNMGIDRKGCPFYVMELLDGETLSDLVSERGPLELNQFLQCFADVCQALKFAHDKKIVHRDIKPSNLMLINSGEPIKSTKVVDFGIARLIGNEEISSQGLTRPGEIFGSPLYMSPEQTLGLPISPATDVYSLGCTMFEIFTGRPPFKGASAFETMLMHQNASLPQVKREHCPPEIVDDVEDILAKCMAKKPQDRFTDVGEILPLLDQLSRSGYGVKKIQSPLVAAKAIPELNFSENTDSQLDSRQINARSKLLVISICCFAIIGLIGILALSKLMPAKVQSANAPNTSAAVVEKISETHQVDYEANSDVKEWLKSPAPISRKFSINKRRWREFYFPQDLVGTISDDGHKQEPASGTLDRITDRPIHFVASDKLSSHPEIYKRFDDQAIGYLSIQAASKPPDIKLLKVWKNLSGLCFNQCQISKIYFEQLGELKNLKELFLIDTQCPGDVFEHSDLLSRLTKLELDHVNSTSIILSAVKPENILSVLTLKGALLGPKEARIIARLSKVVELNIRQCNCTCSVLDAIANLKKLDSLDIRGSKFISGDLNNLLKMHHLKQLRFNRAELSTDLKRKIKDRNSTLRFLEEK